MKVKRWMAMFVAATATWSCGDEVVMKDSNLVLDGQIQEVNSTYLVLVTKDGTGRLKIRRSQIASFKYDLANRIQPELEKVKSDPKNYDYGTLYELGKEAYQKSGQQKELGRQAIACLCLAAGKAKVPNDAWKMLGYALDKEGKFKEAMHAYEQYLLGRPEDAEVKKRYTELCDKLAPKEPKGGGPAAAEKVPEGLETQNWALAVFTNRNPATFTRSKWADGNQYFSVSCLPGGKYSQKVYIRCPVNLDLSRSKAFVYQANCTVNGLQVATAFVSADGEWYETRAHPLKQGWSEVSVDLEANTFKCQKSRWEHNSRFLGRDKVQQLFILLYNGPSEGVVHFDAMGFK